MAKTRVWLMLGQKLALCAHHTTHPDLKRSELSEWAADSFSLAKPLAKSTLADALAADYQGDGRQPKTLYASHTASFSILETKLSAWIERRFALNIAVVTGSIIKHKPVKLRIAMLPDLDAHAAS